MQYVVDTVAIVRHLCKTGKLGKRVSKIFKHADTKDCQIIISSISVMEIMIIAEKNRISLNLNQIISKLQNNSNYIIKDLDSEIILTASKIKKKLELHDRMIVATAKYLKVPLLTCDEQITASNVVETIW